MPAYIYITFKKSTASLKLIDNLVVPQSLAIREWTNINHSADTTLWESYSHRWFNQVK